MGLSLGTGVGVTHGRRPWVYYLDLPGTNGNYASTPDSAVLDITGDLELQVDVALTDWTPGSRMVLLSKWASGQRSYALTVEATGEIALFLSNDGTANASAVSSVATGATDGDRLSITATRRASDHRVQLFIDGSQLGTDLTHSITSIHVGSAAVEAGSWLSGLNPTEGKLYRAQVYDGINGTLVADFWANDATVGSTSVTSSVTGEVWTINQSGSPAAEIKAG